MYSKASHFRVTLRARSAVVAPDPLISLSINSCLRALFISYIYIYIYKFYLFLCILVLIRLSGTLAAAMLGSTWPHSFWNQTISNWRASKGSFGKERIKQTGKTEKESSGEIITYSWYSYCTSFSWLMLRWLLLSGVATCTNASALFLVFKLWPPLVCSSSY